MGQGLANRNLRKDVHVRSEVDASLTILMLNAYSLMNKIDEFITIVQTYTPHIVAITETWLHDQINDAEIAINDYHIFRKDREGRGDGALLLIKSCLRPKQQIQLKHRIGNRAAQIQTTIRLICLLINFSLYSIFAPIWSFLGTLSLPDQ